MGLMVARESYKRVPFLKSIFFRKHANQVYNIWGHVKTGDLHCIKSQKLCL